MRFEGAGEVRREGGLYAHIDGVKSKPPLLTPLGNGNITTNYGEVSCTLSKYHSHQLITVL